MGTFPVRINDRTEIRVKDSVFASDGWHLWMSIWVDSGYMVGDTGPVVPDTEEITLERAARTWLATHQRLVGWCDYTSGQCPLCDKTLAFDPADIGNPGPRHATCGGVGRHNWLVYKRRMRLLAR